MTRYSTSFITLTAAYIGVIAACLTSCDAFLSTDSPSRLTAETMFETEGDMQRAVFGIYAKMSEDRVYGQNITLIMGYNNDIEFGQCNANTDNTRRGIWDYSTTSNNEILLSWGPIYSAINTANECVEGIAASPLLQNSDSTAPSIVRQLYGEAKALRALLYLDLVRNWGDVPFLIHGTRAGDDFYRPVTNRDTILDFLISDLISAEPAMLYASELSETCERMNRSAVQALIARLALTRGGWALRPDYDDPASPGTMQRDENYLHYYRIANTYCRKIRDDGQHSLSSSFADVFRNECQEIYPASDDILFEFPFATSYNGYVGVIIGHTIEGSSNIPYGKSGGWYYATLPYFHSFDNNDIRRDVTCIPYKWEWNNSTGQIEQRFTSWRTIYIGKWNKLWMKTPQGANVQYSSGINFPILRYSDALLMLAETENELNNGPTDDARRALKEVRRRAFAPEYQSAKVDAYVDGLTSHNQFFSAIVNERAWEFGGENIRKYDLIRWNLLRDKLISMKRKLSDMYDNGEYPQFVYTKNNDDGTLSILNLDNTIYSTPAGYTRQQWCDGIQDSNGALNTTFVKSFKDEYIRRDPLVYILPLYKDVITDSRGVLKNYYGLQ